MWKGESSVLLVSKGYWKAFGAKLLRVVDETFCSIPTDSANCCYLDRLTSWASSTRRKPTKKGGFIDSVPAASLMIKSAKDREEKEGSSCSWNCIPFPRGESFYFTLEFLLDYREDNLVILVIKSLFP